MWSQQNAPERHGISYTETDKESDMEKGITQSSTSTRGCKGLTKANLVAVSKYKGFMCIFSKRIRQIVFDQLNLHA